MYFLTSIDPNYSVKGSRDPLGFQVIWQAAGRKLIPHLSTVSSNIKDFQILCLAHAVKSRLKLDDRSFESFFIRFEQLMAYTRFLKNSDEGFNGIDKVRKIISSDLQTVKISNDTAEQILSSQRAYGIWGKYNRPFTEMDITPDPEFEGIYQQKLDNNFEFLKQVQALSKKADGVTQVHKDRLRLYFNMIDRPAPAERRLFTRRLLNDNCGNELLKIVPDLDLDDLLFYERLDRLVSKSSNQFFLSAVEYIKNTEQVLCPLNHIFRYLQTKSFWTIHELEKDELIERYRTQADTSSLEERTKVLALLHQLSNFELVKGLVKRNEEVSRLRKSSPWMRLTSTGLEVNHFDGGFIWESYNPADHNDNNYFLDTYISLFKQLS